MAKFSPPHSPTKNIHNPKRVTKFLPWFFLLSIFFLLSLVYSRYPVQSPRFISNGQNYGERACDLFEGRWVRDRGRGMAYYDGRSCGTVPESNNCAKYGKEQGYVQWRWQPKGCDLPRFDARLFLRIVKGKRMAFVGDSVSRNHMESLLCLLSQVETPVDIQEKNTENRLRTWYFRSHDFILMSLWTKFLVIGTERTVNGSGTGVFDLHLDKVDTTWTRKLPWINYAVISDGHWYFRKNYLYENNKLIGCVYCSEDNLRDYGPSFAIKRAFRTALQHINECDNCDGLFTMLRTFSPAHFENGNWNGGGNCNRTEPLGNDRISFDGIEWELRNAQVEEVQRARKRERKTGKWFRVLDVTKAMMMRADAHPDSHWNNQWMRGYSDCVHWCMPGPIDVWNELLLQVLKADALLD